MGIFNKMFGKSGASELIKELGTLKSRISKIPQNYQTTIHVTGPGAGQARNQIPIICKNVDDTIEALRTGLDSRDRPITKSQITDGLLRLVAATRKPAFIGLISTIMTPNGVREVQNCMNELEKIANKI